jgi:hypothetical protein
MAKEVVGAVGSIVGAGLQSHAAENAAKRQADTAQAALDFQKQQAADKQRRYDAAYADYKARYDAWVRQYYPNYAGQLGNTPGVTSTGQTATAPIGGPTVHPTGQTAGIPPIGNTIGAMATGSSRGTIGAPTGPPSPTASMVPPTSPTPGGTPMIPGTLADLAGMRA